MPMPPETRLIGLPSLFVEHGRIDKYVCEGRTIAQHIADLNWDPATLEARVTVDGRRVDRAQWQFIVPRPGQSIVVRCVPGVGGQGGGGGGKNTMMIVAMLGVVALAIFAPEIAVADFGLLGEAAEMGMAGLLYGSGGIGALMLTAGVGITGMLAANARIPAPLPRRALTTPQPRPILPAAA